MVDRELWKSDDMKDGEMVGVNGGHEALGGVFLVAAAEGEEHTPVAALDVALPGATEFGFQKRLVFEAEIAQVRVTRNDDFPNGKSTNWAVGYIANEFSISVGIGFGQVRRELSVIKKLADRSGEDEASEGIRGFWGVACGLESAGGGIEMIFPGEFIIES